LKLLRTAVVLLAVGVVGCREVPVPPEVQRVEEQALGLQEAGASVYFESEYETYLKAKKNAERGVAREKLRLGWFRNYDRVRGDTEAALTLGRGLFERLESFKKERADFLGEEAGSVRARIKTLDEITLSLGERGEGRQGIIQAGIFLREAEAALERGAFDSAREGILKARNTLRGAEDAILVHIGRYLDKEELGVWKKWIEETVAESKRSGRLAIIVSKLERRLTVYRNGLPLRSYAVGLGINGLLTKTRSGDNATPEGKYRVVGKNPRSQYHKALLINYPNEDDRKRFARAQREGSVPKGASLGGNIEIHGGGRDILTWGCVSMDDGDMDELFDLAGIGTPVTIIGTGSAESPVLKTLEKK
jgi:L,D-peptidoglycan transpeptidase YkuD (ErfK/YbiS/YcfS/YnhG family)